MSIDTMVNAYIECALWSTLDSKGDPLDDRFEKADLTEATLEQMTAEVKDFLALCEQEGSDLSAIEDGQIGHDFWLTRNGHGAGFWDRGLGDLGEELTRIAKSFGTSDLYDHDGWVYVA